jgi:hypothetical protein
LCEWGDRLWQRLSLTEPRLTIHHLPTVRLRSNRTKPNKRLLKRKRPERHLKRKSLTRRHRRRVSHGMSWDLLNPAMAMLISTRWAGIATRIRRSALSEMTGLWRIRQE